VELEQEPERPLDPRPHDQVKCLFFILFLFVLFEEASKLQAPELLRSFSASELLRSFSASELACLLVRLRSLLHCSSKLRSVRACCCNAANSGACPAPELAMLQQQALELQVKGLIGETGRRHGTLCANTESDVQTTRGLPRSQITDRFVQTCWVNRGFPASCAKKGRRPDGGRYKLSLADASLPGYPSMRSGKPVREADEVNQRSVPFHPGSP
jgi:hypothetical protein